MSDEVRPCRLCDGRGDTHWMATHRCPGHERMLAGLPVPRISRPAGRADLAADLEARLRRCAGKQGGVVLPKGTAMSILEHLRSEAPQR